MNTPVEPDADRPLSDPNEDRFGYAGIATRLAPAILKTLETDGMVVGLEGPWGSGKTTLLNFLRLELDAIKPKNVHTISLAPWLGGDHSNLVSSLLDPLAEIIDRIEDEKIAADRQFWQRTKKVKSKLGALLRNYGSKTGRALSPAAKLAEYLVPGAKMVADGLEVGSKYLEDWQRNPTIAETKAEISRQLSVLDIGVVVILDDLDRLEPGQAVEVVRLVRSVADFPKITYVMCYDREALAHALKSGLMIADGDHFLQKIIQLTFTMPLPEPFDMRAHFLQEAKAIYESVNGKPPEGDLLDDLTMAVDREGNELKTPREVKLALNSLRFLYPGLKEDVYFPDVCRLHLIKTTRPELYRWVEQYLGERSVLVAGDASISKHDRTIMGERLKSLCPAEDTDSTHSIWSVRRFIPGVIAHKEPSECVFNSTSMKEVSEMIEHRRLGSPLHYRQYFALTFPKHVMPEHDFNNLIALAAADPSALSDRLLTLARQRRRSGKSWLEHVMDRLDSEKILKLDTKTLIGLITAIGEAMDQVSSIEEKPRPFTVSVPSQAANLVREIFVRLKKKDPNQFVAAATAFASTCQSVNWLVGRFFRDELYAHGRVGDRQADAGFSPFTDEELDQLVETVRARATQEAAEGRVSSMPNLGAYCTVGETYPA